MPSFCQLVPERAMFLPPPFFGMKETAFFCAEQGREKKKCRTVKKMLAKAWALLYKNSCAQVVELVDTLS